MRLRSSKVLQFFAILLFSFELVAPAFLSAAVTTNASAGDSLISTSTGATASLPVCLCEENSSEEEERAKVRCPLVVKPFVFASGSHDLTPIKTDHLEFFGDQVLFNTAPRLFKLHQNFLI